MTKRRVIPERVKREVLDEQGWVCARCFHPVGRDDVEYDHVVALALGGSDDESNICALCRECHRIKTNAKRDHENLLGGDKQLVAKAKRARRMHEEGRPRKRRGRKLQRRGFDKRWRKKLNGDVEPR